MIPHLDIWKYNFRDNFGNNLKTVRKNTDYFFGNHLFLFYMSRKEFRHSERADSVGSKYFGHILVGGEILLVLGILEVVLFYIVPQPF